MSDILYIVYASVSLFMGEPIYLVDVDIYGKEIKPSYIDECEQTIEELHREDQSLVYFCFSKGIRND